MTEGTMRPTTQTISMIPSSVQTLFGNAPNDFTSALTLSNMKTFMVPEARKTRAPRHCNIQRATFIGASGECVAAGPILVPVILNGRDRFAGQSTRRRPM
jgi:hypothetical protein